MNLNFVRHHFSQEFNYQIHIEDNETPIFSHHLRKAIPEELLKRKVLYFCSNNHVMEFHISNEIERNSQLYPDDIFRLFLCYIEDISYARTTLDKVEYVTDVLVDDNQICVYSEPLE